MTPLSCSFLKLDDDVPARLATARGPVTVPTNAERESPSAGSTARSSPDGSIWLSSLIGGMASSIACCLV